MIALLVAAAVQQGALPPYGESIRCAGLAEAATKLAVRDTPEWRKMFDAALFWGLAAAERGQKDRVPATQFKADQIAAREKALAELNAGGAPAKEELAACVRRVP
jgi:hypothetical protein